MGFLIWIESSGFAEWVRASLSGYPIMIACHAFGMAVMVGLSLLVNLRLLGWFDGIPPAALQRFFGVAWIGFGINSLSGGALFAAQATTYIVDVTFMSKMAFVFLGAITVAILQSSLAHADSWGGRVPTGTRVVAALSIVFWLSAIVMGRLTAYL